MEPVAASEGPSLAEGDLDQLVQKIQGADGELLLQQVALGLYQRGCEAGGAAAADVAELVARLLGELPPEQGRVLRRVLLQTAHAQFEAGDGDSGLRLGICQVLCELYEAGVVPETVLHDCLEQLLWDIQDPHPNDIECVCAIMQSVGAALDDSDLDAADEIMEDFFARLQQLAASGVLPYDHHQMVQALLRQRASGWAEPASLDAAPVVALPSKGGAGEDTEDWRAVLDAKRSGNGSGGVQDSTRKEGRGDSTQQELGLGQAEGSAGSTAGWQAAATNAAAAQPPPSPKLSAEERKQQAVQQLLASVEAASPDGGGSPWDVPRLVQEVQGSALDLSTSADAERLLPPLLDAAATAAAAASNGTTTGPTASTQLPLAVEGCAALVSELAKKHPPVGRAATAHLAQTFKQRGQARSPAARQLLGRQMLLAGVLAARGVLPEAQLQGFLEQLARQVMKPAPSDVVCLCMLLRGAGRLTETKKGAWWKAASQLSTSSNISTEQQKELQHLVLLKEAKWDAAAAAAAATELEARSKAEAAAAALAGATLQRQAQEDAAKRAAAELAAADEKIKAASARLAELEAAAAAAEAAAEAAHRAQQQAETSAASAEARRSENDRAATASRKQLAEAEAELLRVQQATSRAAAAPPTPSTSGGGGGEERGRHWYYAGAATRIAPYGPVTATELVAWMYEEPMLGGEMQVCRANQPPWVRLDQKLQDILAELPPMPHTAGQPAVIPTMPSAAPAGGRGGRGAGRGDRFPVPGAGRGGRGGISPSTEFAIEFMPPAQAGQFGGRGGRGRVAGRGGRGRGRGDVLQLPQQQQQQQPQQGGYYAQLQPQAVQYEQPQAALAPAPQQPPRGPSPPRFNYQDLQPSAYTAQPATASAPSRGYNPLGQQARAPATSPADPLPRQIDLCPLCRCKESQHIWMPCGHRGHCSECLPDYLSNEDKLANCPNCLVCNLRADHYIRMY